MEEMKTKILKEQNSKMSYASDEEDIKTKKYDESKRRRPKFIRKVECSVCSDVANDHIHYGAIACYSCRAFFRRAVTGATRYECAKNRTCEITKESRKTCQACRLRKCMEAGMKSSWVMTEEEKLDKKLRAVAKKTDTCGTKMKPPPVKKTEDGTAAPGTLQSYMARRKMYLNRKRRSNQTSTVTSSNDDKQNNIISDPNIKIELSSFEMFDSDISCSQSQTSVEDMNTRNSQDFPDDIFDSVYHDDEVFLSPRHSKSAHSSAATSPVPLSNNYNSVVDVDFSFSKNESSSSYATHEELKVMTSSPSPFPTASVSPASSHYPMSNEMNSTSQAQFSPIHPAYGDGRLLSPVNPVASPTPGPSTLHNPVDDLSMYFNDPTNFQEPHASREVEVFRKDTYPQHNDLLVTIDGRAPSDRLQSEANDSEMPYNDLSVDIQSHDQLWSSVLSPPQPPVLPNLFPVELSMPFTMEEETELRRLVRLEQTSREIIPLKIPTVQGILESIQTGAPLKYETARDGYNTCVQRIGHFVSKLDPFCIFDIEDRKALFRSNVHLAVNIKSARLLRPGNTLRKQIGFANMPGFDPRQENYPISKVGPRLEYHQVFRSPWCSAEDIEDLYQQLMEELFQLEMDDVTHVLLVATTLFSTKVNSRVRQHQMAAQLQDCFLRKLYRYLCARIGPANASNLLPKYQKMLTNLEKMADIMLGKRLPF